MVRKHRRPQASLHLVLEPLQIPCRGCGTRMGHHRHPTVTTLQGVTRLTRHPCLVVATPGVRASISQHDRRKKGDGHCRTEPLGWM